MKGTERKEIKKGYKERTEYKRKGKEIGYKSRRGEKRA